jgi:hypothetical protein
VKRWSPIVDAVMVSGSGYTAVSFESLESLGSESGCSVVDEDTESSASDKLDGVGELPCKGEGESDIVRCFVRIFWVIRV